MQKELEFLFEMFPPTPCNDVFHAICKSFNLKAFKVQSSIWPLQGEIFSQ